MPGSLPIVPIIRPFGHTERRRGRTPWSLPARAPLTVTAVWWNAVPVTRARMAVLQISRWDGLNPSPYARLEVRPDTRN